MSDDLDLGAIDQRHEPDPHFRAALRQRVVAIAAGTEPSGSWTDERDLTEIHLEPTSTRSPVRRSRSVAWGILAVASAAVIVTALAVAISRDDGTTPAETTPAGTTPADTPGRTETGYFNGSGDVPVTFAVPPGWGEELVGMSVVKGEPIFGVTFWTVADLYADPCQRVLVDPPVGPTVDDLASAWTNVPVVGLSAATDITIDGYAGQQIEFTVPDYTLDENCDYTTFALWRDGGRDDAAAAPSFWAQGPNEHHQLWILDVDGTRVVITATSFPDISPQDRADLNEILESIRIG